MNKRVLVVGGSKEFPGAVYLAGITAMRTGAESVLIMTPEQVAWAINSLSPDLMTAKLSGDYLSPIHEADIQEKLKTANVLLIGNGATVREETKELMQSLMKWNGKKVVDADALKVLKNNEVENAVLTPNSEEWNILEKNNDIPTLLHQNNTIIIKGESSTKILFNNDSYEKKNVNQGLHKAGMGDVLAGMCAGYLAQGYSLESAAKEAVALGNSVAEILTEKKEGYHFLASDIAEELKERSFD